MASGMLAGLAGFATGAMTQGLEDYKNEQADLRVQAKERRLENLAIRREQRLATQRASETTSRNETEEAKYQSRRKEKLSDVASDREYMEGREEIKHGRMLERLATKRAGKDAGKDAQTIKDGRETITDIKGYQAAKDLYSELKSDGAIGDDVSMNEWVDKNYNTDKLKMGAKKGEAKGEAQTEDGEELKIGDEGYVVPEPELFGSISSVRAYVRQLVANGDRPEEMLEADVKRIAEGEGLKYGGKAAKTPAKKRKTSRGSRAVKTSAYRPQTSNEITEEFNDGEGTYGGF